MEKDIYILGIETSCDETGAAIVKNGREIVANVIASQIEFHKKFGGVVPELASRKHLEIINPVLDEVLEQAGIGFGDLDAVAVTIGPGLVGALLMGLGAAKVISYVKKLPLVGVDHIEAHIYSNFIDHPDLKPPFVALVVSGGHTMLVYIEKYGSYELMGQTLDDSVGEAYDKVAAFLGLGYPGGPIIDDLAKEGNTESIRFPRAMIGKGELNFSLSGLKTAVLNYVSNLKLESLELPLPDLAASFQAAVVDVLVSKTIRAARQKGVEKIVLAGGVAANSYLRERMTEATRDEDMHLYYPSISLCTDNAIMIAASGYYRFIAGERLSLESNPIPNLRLGQSIEGL
ncbi:MAG: tRNA (adenosine(37)-N6)-threonylcarbamoyltransferase complex transferase subunit TsaD [Actinomycetota bacterium]|nr:tRNA (adenosine(37)-N6)-threonylcarbamoyltransferase complex transferase subunit TsaD [Actinomycetota bacterium]